MVSYARVIYSCLMTGLGAYAIAEGTTRVANHIFKVDSIRDAVYRTATSITPEVIARANDLASQVSLSKDSLGTIAIGVALMSLGYWAFKSDEVAEITNYHSSLNERESDLEKSLN